MSAVDQLAELEQAKPWHLALTGDAQTREDAWRDAQRMAAVLVDDLEIPVPRCWYVHAGVVVALLGLQYGWDNERSSVSLFFDADRLAHCDPWSSALKHSVTRHPRKDAPEQEEALLTFDAYVAAFQTPPILHAAAPPQGGP